MGLLTCDAIAKASTPPLIVLRALEAEGDMPFNNRKYVESEREILMGKAGNKVRFIDKETTEEANYYLYGIISQVNIPSSNDNRNNIRKKRSGIQSAANLQQAADNNQITDNNNPYKLTMSLVDPRSNTTLWKDEFVFTPVEMPQSKQRYK